MRKKTTIFMCLLLVSCMLVASAVVIAKKPDKPPKPPPGGGELGTEYQITFSEDGGDEYYPEIYGNIIVWQDTRYGLPDIFMLDLGEDGIPYTDDDGGETRITSDPTTKQNYPGIGENRIVYTSNENGKADIYLYDIPTGITTQITMDPENQWGPKIYGDYIVWTDNRNGNNDIYAYDLSVDTDNDGIKNYLEDPRLDPDPAEYPITTDPAPQRYPYVYGDIIVWTDFRTAAGERGMDIYMYKFSTGQEYAITDDDFTQKEPHIWDNKIVWQDNRNERSQYNEDIYMYDLGPDGIPFTGDTGEGEYQLTSGSRRCWWPRLYGDLVAFWGFRQSKTDIYIYNLVSGDTDQITRSTKARTPFIYEDHIVYSDARDGTYDIYLFILNE